MPDTETRIPNAGSRNLAGWLGVPAACVVSMAALLLAFAPYDHWPLAYVALVPWTLAMALSPRRWYALLWAYLSGLMFWLAGLYWIWWVDVIGFFALVTALSVYMLGAGALIRPALRRRLPAVAVLPVVWISIEFIRLYGLSGFPWFALSHSQYRNTMLIQSVDWMGELGPGLLVAMVNGVLVDGVLAAWRLRRSTGILPVSRMGVSPMQNQPSDEPSAHKGTPASWPDRHGQDARATWCGPAVGAAACLMVAGGLLGYGHFRLSESTLHDGPVVAIVQHAYPIYINAEGGGASVEAIYREHLASTRALAGSGVELVVWPESMGPPLLNREFLTMDFHALSPHERRALAAAMAGPTAWSTTLSDNDIAYYIRRYRDGDMSVGTWDYARELAQTSRDLNAVLLIGSCTVHRNGSPLTGRDLYARRNSVVLIDREPIPVGEYSKKHLVPFGEYVPFKQGWPGLHTFLRSFVPEEMPQLDPGTEETILSFTPRRTGVSPMQDQPVSKTLTSSSQHGRDARETHGQDARATGDAGETPATRETVRIAAPICYEGVIARLCRSLVMNDGRKRADMIVNQSNDGWFVHRDGLGPWQGSTEQPQHLAQYVFRAVENRVPVVRAVNTGISAYVDSTGRIRATVVDRDGQHVMISGTLILDGNTRTPGHGPRVQLDTRVSPYGRWGNVFPWILLATCMAMTVYLVVMSRRTGKREPLV